MAFLFEEGRVTENGGILPENAAALGCAFGQVMGKKIVVSSSAGTSAMMIKNALISGILSSGARVLDFGEQPASITRRGIKFYNLDGGFHVSERGNKITLLGKDGLILDEEKEKEIAGIYSTGGMSRAGENAIKEVVTLHSYKLYYLRDIINRCNEQLGFKVLVCVNNTTTGNIVTAILKDMGCKYTLYKGKEDDDFSRVVKNEGYDIGIYIDKSGERFTLYDETGEKINEDIFQCICAIMVFSSEPDKVFYCGYHLPSSLEQIAENMGGSVIRSNHPEKHIMDRLSGKNDLGLRFILRFDVVGSIIKILDFLKENNISLKTLALRVPEFYVCKKEYILNEELLHEVTKKLGIEKEGKRIEESKGWSFIQKNKNLIKVVCEGVSMEASTELMGKYEKLLGQ